MGFNLDIAKMKFLKSDDKSTTLQHPKGHTVTIAHNVLSPKNREALQALSKVATDARTPDQASEYGKVVKKFAHGGKPTLTPNTSPQPMYLDEGGKVPVPNQPDAGQQNKQARAEGIAKGSQQGTAIPDASTLISRLKNAWAEGGKIEQMRSQHGGEGNETCHACGGPIHRARYEDGTPNQPVSKLDTEDVGPEVANNDAFAQQLNDVGGVKGIIPYQPEESPYSRDTAAKRQEYNDIVAGHNAGFFADPQDVSGVGATKRAQFGPNGEPPQEFDPKAWNQMEHERAQAKEATAAQLAAEAQKNVEYNQAAQQAGVPLKPTDDVPGNQDTNNVVSGAPTQQLQGQPQSQGQQAQPADQFSTAGYQGAVNELAHIQRDQLANQIQARQDAMDTYKNSLSELEQERHAHIQDIQKGYVDPNNYWKDHSKVATGIGMILAGFNPTNRPNAAIEFLQHQMNQSLDAQKANLNAKNNLLAANLHHFGDLHQATLMTQAMMNDTLAQQMQQAALNAKNPLAKQAALGASTQLMQNAMLFQRQLAMQRTMMNLANGGGNPETQAQAIAMAKMVSPEYGKTLGEAFVPGVGLSKSLTPIPENVREQIASGQKLQNAAQDLIHYTATHTNINPLSAEYKVGTQKALILQQMVREGLLGTVFRESEKPLLNAFVNENPANAFKHFTSEPKLRTLLESSVNALNATKQTYGLPTAQVPSEARQPSAPQYQKMSGVNYQKVPGGWQKVK